MMQPPFGYTVWLWIGGIAAALGAYFSVKRIGSMEERARNQKRALEDQIETKDKLTELEEAERDLAEDAQDAGRSASGNADDELSDDLERLIFGRSGDS